MQFVYISNVFGSCIIHILFTGCTKIKKNNSGAKRLIHQAPAIVPTQRGWRTSELDVDVLKI